MSGSPSCERRRLIDRGTMRGDESDDARRHRHHRHHRRSSSYTSSSSVASDVRDGQRRRRRYRRRRHRSRSILRHRHSSPSSTYGAPSATVMIRGLPTRCDEQEIRDEISSLGYTIIDLRISCSGHQRIPSGFLEFSSVSEAEKFMESTNGYYLLMNEYPLTLSFTAARSEQQHHHHQQQHYKSNTKSERLPTDSNRDWECVSCGIRNFKRRDYCFKCQMSRSDSNRIRDLDGFELTTNIPSDTLIVLGLSYEVTNTEPVLEAVVRSAPNASTPKNSYLARNVISGLSRCFALIEFDCVADCMTVIQAMQQSPLTIANSTKELFVNYCKSSFANVVYELSDPNRGTGAILSKYEMTAAAAAFAQLPEAQADRANVAASVAYNALQNLQHNKRSSTSSSKESNSTSTLNNNANFSSYKYDPSSGYYYDTNTGFYFDPKSQLFYNAQTQRCMYWNAQSAQYIYAAATTAFPTNNSQQMNAQTNSTEEKTNTALKPKKSEDAKNIALQMAKWAENVNRKKSSNSSRNINDSLTDATISNEQTSSSSILKTSPQKHNDTLACTDVKNQSDSAVAAACAVAKAAAAHAASYAIPPSRPPKQTPRITIAPIRTSLNNVSQQQSQISSQAPPKPVLSDITSRKRAIKDERNVVDNKINRQTEHGQDDHDGIIDWNKLACLLCRRQFDSNDILKKHIERSKLHLDNLNKKK